MKRWFVAMSLLLAACNQSSAAAHVSPSASAASTDGAGSTPIATTSPTQLPTVNFSCRLPVVTSIPGSTGINFQGGFIQFPAARLTDDPGGTMLAHSNDVETAAAPVLAGDGVDPFYDRAQSRWVPTQAGQSLADGSQYAHVTFDSTTGIFTVHVTTVATGSSRSFRVTVSELTFPQVADFGPAGVYMYNQSGLGGPGEGLWLLDPQTGAMRQVRAIPRLWMVRNGYAWVARLDPRDKTVWTGSELAPANSLVRIDLATGSEIEWYYQAGHYPWLQGLDSSGRPLVTLGASDGNEIRLIDQPGSSGRVVYRGNIPGLGYVQGDRDRLWFGTYDGIYLYTPSQGFARVFAWPGDSSNSKRIEPAGLCI